MHKKDSVMDVVVTSTLQKSCLTQSITSSDYVIKKAENLKFGKDSRYVDPIQLSPLMRFIPLAMNHLGLRSSHFNAALREFATQMVMRPNGCSSMSGPFALSLNGALRKLLFTWGARLTWTAQRHHAAQILNGMDSFYANASFLSAYARDHVGVECVLPNDYLPRVTHSQGIGIDLTFNRGGVHGQLHVPDVIPILS
jgi:hypothetical protein